MSQCQHNRLLNWKKDRPDSRDLLFRNEATFSLTLPKSVSLKSKMSKVEDQGELGSCTANAFAGNLEYLWLKKKDRFQASRLFIYFNEREVLGTLNEDSGALIRDGIKTLAKFGVCSETLVPYDITQFTVRPSAAAYAEAKNRRISKYMRITDLASLKQCLADGFPIVFGIPVFESFMSDAVARTGLVPMPQVGEAELGGHAMLAVGYNDRTNRVIVRNSWGSEWGAGGYCQIPYDYFGKADDLWTVRA